MHSIRLYFALICFTGVIFVVDCLGSTAASKQSVSPNILWITCEDMSPNLGCYGDSYARTPHLDALAAQGVRYTRAFAPTGVCATARSSLIMGTYASSIGTQAMRCQATLPESLRPFPYYLRKAGYYCCNKRKTDYNFKIPAGTWDTNGAAAHWNKRKPGQPFFAVVNHTITHESRIRGAEKLVAGLSELHDPDKANVPPYLPNTPIVRRDWARYHDLIEIMDSQAGDLLKELKQDGLAEDTIVFFFSDHGVGLPRAKQFIFDAGMQVPLIVYFPEKWKHLAPVQPGAAVDRMVNFVDFGPTVLSLAGIPIPNHMQGIPFLGKATQEPRKFIHGIRDRMDERIDMNRTVRDHRFKYHRNYMPHLPHYPWLDYMDKLETSKEMRRLAKAGKLTGGQAYFMSSRKSLEELYDLTNDPYELNNLADDPQYADELNRLREAHFAWTRRTLDSGLIPEHMLRTFAQKTSEYQYVRSQAYQLERCIKTIRLIEQDQAAIPQLINALKDDYPPVRYWAATGLATLGGKAAIAERSLITALDDAHPEVALAAAEALCYMGKTEPALPVIEKHLADERQIIRITAANIADRIDERALPLLDVMRRETKTKREGKYQFFTSWILDRAIAELEENQKEKPPSHAGSLIDIGVASIDITPQIPIRLQGFPRGARSKDITKIAQPIHAKALAIGLDKQGPRLLVVADLIGVSEKISEQLFQRLKRRVGFDERARLVVTSTHNHSAPAVDTVIPFIFRSEPTQEQADHIKQYTAWLLDRLEQVTLAALKNRRPSRFTFARGSVGFAINRRVIKDGKWTGFGQSPQASVDHDMPMLSVYDKDGALRAVWLNYACHGVCWHEPSVHGDWMGIARQRFEEAHPGATAILTIGCAGDQNPLSLKSESVEIYGRQIVDEIERLLNGPQQPIRNVPTVRFKRIELPYGRMPTTEEWAQRKDWYGRTVARQIQQGKPIPQTMPYIVQTWSYGNDLTQVFLAGEVVVDYSLRLKRELDRKRLWVSAYANSQPAYIPSKQMLAEAGYEVDTSRISYGVPARLSEKAEDLIIYTVHELVPATFDRILHQQSGVLLLKASEARTVGPKIKFMPKEKALGWWTDRGRAEWNVDVVKEGLYDVVLTWSVAEKSAGRPYVLSVNGKPQLKGTIKSTGSWETFRTEKIGRITLKAGQCQIVIKPGGKFTKALMDLRDVRLVPVP